MDDVRLRRARADDLLALVALENSVFDTDRLSPRSFRRLIGAKTAAMLVAEAGRHLAGYALVLFREPGRSARLYSIAIARNYSGRKLGVRLLAAAEAEARARGCATLRLEVRADNHRAAALYRSAGYSPRGERANYYEDGATALRFEKGLAPSEPSSLGTAP